MTIDLSNIKYSVVALLANGTKLFLENAAESIGWEDNERELAIRLNLTLRDTSYDGGRLSGTLPLCTAVYLYANWGNGNVEIFRGTVWEWSFSQIQDDSIILTCYDHLYYLQKSQDSKYYAKGAGTQSIITDILKSWKVPIGEYKGPKEKHKKILYKTKTIASMITETLADAHELGGIKAFIRSTKGKAEIVPFGSNEDVYVFSADQNIETSSDKYSMTDLVTRVVVVGKDDSKGRPKVEATVNGKTEYGILQAYHSRGDATLAEAKKAAQKILDEKGKPKRTTTIRAPDFPLVRKGDKVYIKTGLMKGYFYVKGISHNATARQMNMEVEPV